MTLGAELDATPQRPVSRGMTCGQKLGRPLLLGKAGVDSNKGLGQGTMS